LAEEAASAAVAQVAVGSGFVSIRSTHNCYGESGSAASFERTR